ncbi:MAG: TonB-dependent receptor [Bacteroidia bacterium]|nr:TonB-dependent receptor [Bacteroidia bacterium]
MLIPYAGIAQEQWESEGEIENVEIEILKERQIVLPRAIRNFEKVPPRPIEPIDPEITYEFTNLRFNVSEYNPQIRPLKLKTEELSKIYGNYLSAGFGNYASPYLEAWFNTKRDKNKSYGAHIYHQSFGKGPVDDKNSASTNSTISVFGKSYTKTLASGGFINYENIGGYFYGYRPTTVELDRENFKQSYNISKVGVEIENVKPSDFNFDFKAGFSYLDDYYKAKESEVALNFKSDYSISETSKIDFAADYFLVARKDSLRDAAPRHLLKVRPAYTFEAIDKLWLTIGLNTAIENDTLGNAKSFHVYPNLKANYKLGESVDAYVGVTGDMDKVSLHTLSGENLWVNKNLDIFHTNRSIDFFGGIKGKIGRKAGFGAGFSYANLKGLYFYQNSNINRTKFNVIYDNGNTQRTNFFAELNITHAEFVKVNLRGDYFNYSTDELLEAYHRPTYRATLNTSSNIYKKLLLNIDFIAQGGSKAFDSETLKIVELSPALDLNVKVDYFVSKQFSVFLKLNNLLSTEYQVYLNYPVRGFQAMGGISWSF